MDEIKVLSTEEAIKVFSDPYRLKILNSYNYFKEPKTVKEIADYLGEVPAKIHYHVKKMVSADILRLVYTKEINGIIAKYYEPTAEDFSIGDGNLKGPLSQTVKNETAKFISNIYDESRICILKQIEEASKDKNGNNLTGYLTASTLNLTKEEADEFKSNMQNLIRKYEKRADTIDTDDHNDYHVFISFMPIKY